MNGCEKIRPLLSAYADGQLSRTEEERVRLHLQHCPDCAQEVREWTDFDLLLQDALALEAPPPGMLNSVWAVLEEDRRLENQQNARRENISLIPSEPDYSFFDFLSRQALIAAGWAGGVALVALVLFGVWPEGFKNLLAQYPQITLLAQEPGALVERWLQSGEATFLYRMGRSIESVRHVYGMIVDFYGAAFLTKLPIWGLLALATPLIAWFWRRQISQNGGEGDMT
ncbi:hypothetical protein GTO91_00110 [Heliobacterium undosum]|uniref:Anti-sigma-W factor RsiW n=1 Tax=Heliomicrobium undosum TaxID=121734 RepID=A0A845KXA2_9FIRM|nr:zf-HC2 domain-containing protein [Heliomicrobium undosum]MZP28127.1 hypothetical protein [Heliomicrobium undosum]